MNVAIVKYNAGNIMSVSYALQRLGIDPIVTDDPLILKAADKVIFPGVGEASTAMNYIRQHSLDEVIKDLKQPFLGICLGMQLMGLHSEEGDTPCLGIFSAKVKKFPSLDKVPHMGWNQITDCKSPLLKGVDENSFVYFVHSYYVELCDETAACCNYILPFSAGMHKDNFYAFQFHPEKSGETGALLLKNFIEL